MKNLRCITLLLLAVLLNSCFKDLGVNNDNHPGFEPWENPTYAITPEMAAGHVNKLLNGFESQTKGSTGQRIIASVQTIEEMPCTKSNTKAPVSPKYHIVNFENDQGFAIVAADSRIEPVFCIIDEGSYDLFVGDINNTVGIGMLLDNYDTAYRLAVGMPVLDESGEWVFAGHIIEDSMEIEQTRAKVTYDYTDYRICSRYGRPTGVSWGQDYPYNGQAPMLSGGRASGGCGAAAIAQVMAAYEYPNSYNGLTFDWDVMKVVPRGTDAANNMVASLYFNINKATGATYGATTSTLVDNIKKGFTALGYFSGGEFYDKNIESVQLALQDRRPVIMFGNAIKKYEKVLGIIWSTWYTNGHFWVVDEMWSWCRDKIQYRDGVYVTTTYEYLNYCRCNWGWDGSRNGYYLWNVWNTNAGPAEPGTRAVHREGTERYYKFNIKQNANIRR